MAAQTADLLRGACRRAGYAVDVRPELPLLGTPYVTFSAEADVVRRLVVGLERLRSLDPGPRQSDAVVIPLTRRDMDDPWDVAELAVEELAEALLLAGVVAGGLRVSGEAFDGPYRSARPVLVEVGEVSPVSARRMAAVLRRGARA